MAVSTPPPSPQDRALCLSVSNLTKSYGDAPPVVNNVSLHVRSGDALALIGSNGSGKSTLLRCALRLIEPNSGTISLGGTDITHLSGKALRHARSQVGFVFQKHNLVPRLSVLTNVLHGAQSRASGPRVWFQSLARQADREEAFHCLELVGLAQFASRNSSQLSGGQSQRVAIARALMQRPKILVADEPVASLDPQVGEEIMDLFARLVADRGLTLICATHHLEHALKYATRVVGLRAGKIELDEPAASQNIGSLRGIYG